MTDKAIVGKMRVGKFRVGSVRDDFDKVVKQFESIA